MTREVPTTRYFAVGVFTAEQLEEKHRAMLAGAARNAAVPAIRSAVEAVRVTVFNIDTGIETVEMGISKVSLTVQDIHVQASGVSFAVERFDSKKFPGGASPQEAFKHYLASADGIAAFGKAMAVQLFSIDVDAFKDLAKS
jgi:hypothetical protein